MSLLTAEQRDTFDLRDIPSGHDGVIPPSVAEHKLVKAKAKTFLSLQARFAKEAEVIRKLVGAAEAAEAADRHALSVAVASGAPDPGSPTVETLADKVSVQRRQLVGLGDTLGTAYRNLVEALTEHREAIEADLDFDQTERRARAEELIAELESSLSAAALPDATVRWLGLATDPQRHSWGGWPSAHVPTRPVVVQGAHLQLTHVIHGLRAAV